MMGGWPVKLLAYYGTGDLCDYKPVPSTFVLPPTTVQNKNHKKYKTQTNNNERKREKERRKSKPPDINHTELQPNANTNKTPYPCTKIKQLCAVLLF